METKSLITQLIYAGNYCGPDGALALARRTYREEKAKKNDHRWVPLASAYYSAAGHFRSVRRPLRGIFYLLLALRCVLAQLSRTSPYELSSSELDVCAAVLRVARFRRRALGLVDEALNEDRRTLSPDNQVLLVANKLRLLAEINGWKDDSLAHVARRLYLLLLGAEGLSPAEASPGARVRGLRALAVYYRAGGHDYREYVVMAIRLCHEHNLAEPLGKLEAEFPPRDQEIRSLSCP